uniref:Uncharacterized protein n=1 Tax=Ditylenchus dipsaci TaxID=166011 RepID=A0A915ELQ9_9BILA
MNKPSLVFNFIHTPTCDQCATVNFIPQRNLSRIQLKNFSSLDFLRIVSNDALWCCAKSTPGPATDQFSMPVFFLLNRLPIMRYGICPNQPRNFSLRHSFRICVRINSRARYLISFRCNSLVLCQSSSDDASWYRCQSSKNIARHSVLTCVRINSRPAT